MTSMSCLRIMGIAAVARPLSIAAASDPVHDDLEVNTERQVPPEAVVGVWLSWP
jgi:hypothetical protein